MRNIFKNLTIFIFFVILVAPKSYAFHPFPFSIKDADGNLINSESSVPYSPRKTCGDCHIYETVTEGFHFQQGRDEYSPDFGNINPGYGFNSFDQSPGMFGKWEPFSYRQLARKDNASPSAIDLSAFEWAIKCGICHPGGGPMEFDRDGNFYDRQAALMDIATLDGDYYGHVKDWQESGVLEADCLMCHLEGYNIIARNIQVESGNFRTAPFAGAGLGDIIDNQTVVYSKDELLSIDDRLNTQPADENCCQCHAADSGNIFAATGEIRSDIAKRGFSWNNVNNPDVHNKAGIRCVDCHTGRLKHQISKGHNPDCTVRDDLDNTIMKCAGCHIEGGYIGAMEPEHPDLSPVHLEKIDCATCHIPVNNFMAVRTMDYSTGSGSSSFIGGSPEDTDNITGFNPVYFKWESAINGEEKIFPGNPVTVVYWNDGVDPNPVFSETVSAAFASLPEGTIKDDTGDGVPEVNTKEEIEAMALALRDYGVYNPKLLALKPEKPYQISHNVAPADKALACTDCHTYGSYFFSGEVMIYNYDIDENATDTDADDRFIFMKEFTGYSQELIDEMESIDTSTSKSICPVVLISGGENHKTSLLRIFRDNVLQNTEEGREYIRLFYKYSPEITSIMIKNPKIKIQAENILDSILPCVQLLIDNNKSEIPDETREQLISLCDSICKKSSPNLKKTVDLIKKNLLKGALLADLQTIMH